MSLIRRQPKGTPTGGQFAAGERAESGALLSDAGLPDAVLRHDGPMCPRCKGPAMYGSYDGDGGLACIADCGTTPSVGFYAPRQVAAKDLIPGQVIDHHGDLFAIDTIEPTLTGQPVIAGRNLVTGESNMFSMGAHAAVVVKFDGPVSPAARMVAARAARAVEEARSAYAKTDRLTFLPSRRRARDAAGLRLLEARHRHRSAQRAAEAQQAERRDLMAQQAIARADEGTDFWAKTDSLG